jgi:hypothetical protein
LAQIAQHRQATSEGLENTDPKGIGEFGAVTHTSQLSALSRAREEESRQPLRSTRKKPVAVLQVISSNSLALI